MDNNNKMITRPGRPKLYDSEIALKAAGEVFWAKGFNGTSLDDLANAMKMNRPSIYRAFGDKEGVYRQALKQFGTIMDEVFNQTLNKEKDIRKGLKMFYLKAIEVYCSDESALGCMVWSTAPASTLIHPKIKTDLLAAINHIDAMLLQRLKLAIAEGQLNKNIDANSLSKLIQALLHSISIRVRAGEPTTEIKGFIDSAILILLVEN